MPDVIFCDLDPNARTSPLYGDMPTTLVSNPQYYPFYWAHNYTYPLISQHPPGAWMFEGMDVVPGKPGRKAFGNWNVNGYSPSLPPNYAQTEWPHVEDTGMTFWLMGDSDNPTLTPAVYAGKGIAKFSLKYTHQSFWGDPDNDYTRGGNPYISNWMTLLRLFDSAFEFALSTNDDGYYDEINDASEWMYQLRYYRTNGGQYTSQTWANEVACGTRLDLVNDQWLDFEICWQCGTLTQWTYSGNKVAAADGWIKVTCNGTVIFDIRDIPLIFASSGSSPATPGTTDIANVNRLDSLFVGWGLAGLYDRIQVGYREPSSEFVPDGSFGPIVWVEFSAPDGTTKAWAPVTLADPPTYYHGYKEAKLLTAGTIARSLSDEQGQYTGQRFAFNVSDMDRYLASILGSNDLLLNRRVVMRIVSDVERRALGLPRTVGIGLIRGYTAE